jgi:hypothetical protein
MKLLREPLVQFLVLGALLFAASSVISRYEGGGDTRRIVITQGLVGHLSETFAAANQREPTADELRGLVDTYVRDEVYYREALALGLDKDDALIRQRLRAKMEFISEDVAAQAEPTDAQLTAYLKAHPEKFRVEERLSFDEVYFNPARRGAHLDADVTAVRASLNSSTAVSAPANAAALGDPLLVPSTVVDESLDEVAKDFGETFAAALDKLPVGQWSGPVGSGFGVHLVYLRQRSERHAPQLSEVRDAVHREWAEERRVRANETFYATLLKRYTVTLEPAAKASPPLLAKADTQ